MNTKEEGSESLGVQIMSFVLIFHSLKWWRTAMNDRGDEARISFVRSVARRLCGLSSMSACIIW